jgi:hypothetical protein
MATILEFRPAASRGPQQLSGDPAMSASSSAELIFFPGIRYERDVAACEQPVRQAAAKGARKRRARAHDSIDLPD